MTPRGAPRFSGLSGTVRVLVRLRGSPRPYRGNGARWPLLGLIFLALAFLLLPTRSIPRNHDGEADGEKHDEENYAQNHDDAHVKIIARKIPLCNLLPPYPPSTSLR